MRKRFGALLVGVFIYVALTALSFIFLTPLYRFFGLEGLLLWLVVFLPPVILAIRGGISFSRYQPPPKGVHRRKFSDSGLNHEFGSPHNSYGNPTVDGYHDVDGKL